MSANATPAPPIATPAKQNQRRFTKCQAGHTMITSISGNQPCPSAPQGQARAISATAATQNEGGCDQVPRLSNKTKVEVANCQRNNKCHACHANQNARSCQLQRLPHNFERHHNNQTCPSARHNGRPRYDPKLSLRHTRTLNHNVLLAQSRQSISTFSNARSTLQLQVFPQPRATF